MNWFQTLGLSGVGLVLAATVWALFARKARLRSALFWILFWAAAATAIARPKLTQRIASALGIDRGADLVSYSFILGASVAFYWIWLRLRQLNRQITLLVREQALSNPRLPDGAQGRELGATRDEALGSSSDDATRI